MYDSDYSSPVSSQSQGTIEKTIDLYDSTYTWLETVSCCMPTADEETITLMKELDSKISDVTATIYPFPKKLLKNEPCGLLLNALLELKQKLKNGITMSKVSNRDSGVFMEDNEMQSMEDFKNNVCDGAMYDDADDQMDLKENSSANSPPTGVDGEFIHSQKRKFVQEPSSSDEFYELFGGEKKPKKFRKHGRSSKLSISGNKKSPF